jgi:hypothetical protein
MHGQNHFKEMCIVLLQLRELKATHLLTVWRVDVRKIQEITDTEVCERHVLRLARFLRYNSR